MGATVLMAEDMVSAYPGERGDLFYDSGIHFSEEGTRQLARFIFEEISDD